MLLNRHSVLVLCATAAALLGCRNASGPSSEIRTHIVELTPAPSTTTVIRQESEIVIRGGVLATCAPYGLNATAAEADGTLVITLTGAIAGTACPHDIVWTRGYRATVSGVPAKIRLLRVLHTTDVSGATPEVIFEGPIS